MKKFAVTWWKSGDSCGTEKQQSQRQMTVVPVWTYPGELVSAKLLSPICISEYLPSTNTNHSVTGSRPKDGQGEQNYWAFVTIYCPYSHIHIIVLALLGSLLK